MGAVLVLPVLGEVVQCRRLLVVVLKVLLTVQCLIFSLELNRFDRLIRSENTYRKSA